MNGLLINLKSIIHINRNPIPESSMCRIQMGYSKKSKLDLLIISLLLINVIVIYLLVFIFFYLPYSEEIIEIFISFEYFYYLILLIIVVVIRIIVASYLSFFFLKRWKSQKIQHYSEIPFLFGLFFYINMIMKFLDIVVFIMYVGDEFFSTATLLNLFKIRHIIGTICCLTLLSIGVYLFFFKRNLNKESLEREKIIKKNVKIVLAVWIGVYLFIIFFSPSMFFLMAVYLMFSTVLGLIIWVFMTAYKGKILSDINPLLISVGFAIYFLFHLLPTILILILGTTIYWSLIVTLIAEIGILISFIIILIGFKNKAKY